jgi:uncharacterized membrane protein YcaP (DUF421 family)
LKNHLKLFDNDYQKELKTKTEALSQRLNEINEGKDEFFKSINKAKIDELFKKFASSKEVEDYIFKTISKMEALKNNHEESAFIFVKLKDMLDQHDKVEQEIIENDSILDNICENIAENKKAMLKNIETIKQRLSKIK